MIRTLALAVAFLFALTGCSFRPLIIRQYDTPVEKTGKFLGRSVLWVLSGSFSEHHIDHIKDRERMEEETRISRANLARKVSELHRQLRELKDPPPARE